MASWTHSDWITQTTPSARATKLRQHIKEVADKLDAEIAAGGKSRSTNNLQAYHSRLLERLDREEAAKGPRKMLGDMSRRRA